MDRAVVATFHRTAQLRWHDLFENERLMPITALEDAHTPAPGWVGKQWSNGTLLIGINPGGGGDGYRRNPADDTLYSLLRRFKDARSPSDQLGAFEEVSEAWIEIQRSHNIWRVISAILEATGEAVEACAFINILPFRTRMDAAAPAATLRAAWRDVARPQIEVLQPKRVVALGKKAWDVLCRMEMPTDAKLILFKRAIGDSYIPAESKIVLSELRQESPPKA